MKLWRWFVGQVARLRRPVVGVPGSGPQPLHAEDRLAADELAPGPPAHWVERVRRGAPGLLEPSHRRRGGPVEPPSARRLARSPNELDPEPESLEEPEHGYPRTEPTVAPQRPEAPVGARRLSRSAPARAAVSPDTDKEPPPAEADRTRFVAENRNRSASPRPLAEGSEQSQGPPVPDKPARSQGGSVPGKTVRFQAPPEPDKQERASESERFPEHSEVVSFEAPVQRRAARLERTGPPPETDVSRRTAKRVPHAEFAVDEIKTDLFREQADPWPSPAPIRGADRLPERLVSPGPSPPEPGPSPPEPSVAPVSPTGRRADPLTEAGVHPWPELPPPLDQPDSDVEAALRAWEHQRRLDLEQTRL